MGRVLWAALWVAAVVSMPIKEPVTMLDESYTDAETEHGLPELDDSLSKSMEAASLTKKAHEALEKAGSASAIAHSILEAVTVAKAKVKSTAALVAVAQKNYDDSSQQLQGSQDAAASATVKKEKLQTEWTSAKKHESSTVVVSAKAMKEASASQEDVTRLRAKAVLTEREYAHLMKEDRLAKHAYHMAATKSADAARKSAELAQEAHEALETAESDPNADSDGSSETAATKSAMASRSGLDASKLAHDAASVGQFAIESAKKVSVAKEAMVDAKKALAAATGKEEGDQKKVKAAISVAVQAKKDFETVDSELNGKDGEVGDSHAKAMQLAESKATVDAALEALNKAKVELKTVTEKFSKLDARGREAEAEAEARKAAARAASKAATGASKAAAEMAAQVADASEETAETVEQTSEAQPTETETSTETSTANEQKQTSSSKEDAVMLGDSDDVDEAASAE